MELRKLLLIAFVFSGMAALIYEITWIRPLQFILGSTIYTISIIFAAFMAGLSLGAMIISKYSDNIKDLPRTYVLFEIGMGLYGVLLLFIFKLLPNIYRLIYNLHETFYLFEFVQFLVVFGILLIPTTLMGATFPIIVKFYTKEKIGKSVGEVYSANNIGAIIGSFAVGFILIPLIGIRGSIIFAGTINILIGSIILFQINKNLFKKIIPLIFILFLILALIGNYNIQKMYFGGFSSVEIPKSIVNQTEVLYYKEGIYSTISVIKEPLDGALTLLINGKGQGSASFKDIRVILLLSYLPYLLNENHQNSLVIGLGTGMTSGTLAQLTKTTTVEIEPRVIEASRYFEPYNLNPLENQNHTIIIDDARNYLLKSDEKYDIISQEPTDPWYEFSTNLYSKEFFELVNQHLNEKGVFIAWVPVYTMTSEDVKAFYKTFNYVFPHVLVFANVKENEKIPFNEETSELIFVGSKEEIDYKDKINQKFDSLPEQAKTYLSTVQIINQSDLSNLFVASEKELAGYLKSSTIITDDNSKLEFSTARRFLERNATEIISEINNYLKEQDE